MSVYNEEISEIKKSINSVLQQTYKKFEYIIVCDNPNDSELADFLNEIAETDNRIIIIYNDVNEGPVLSRNHAVSISKYNYIAIMDADDIMRSDRLDRQLEFMINNDLDISFSNVSLIDRYDNITRKNIYKIKDVTDQVKIRNILMDHSIALGPTIMFKKDKFMSLNGYRNMNVEDYDLVCRFLVKKFKMGFISDDFIKKRLREDSISFKTLYEQYVIMKSISSYMKKYRAKAIVPASFIDREVSKIKHREINSYEKYANYRYKYNDDKSLKNLFYLVVSILLSKTVLVHTFWSIKNNIVEKTVR